ncbi:MAG TPA: protein TolA [Porticoccaceae bacterium]|nr:protein TolA [Porticoccaceae bacterium]
MAKPPGYSTAVFSSISLHGLLLVVLIAGWTPETKHKTVQPKYIQATLLQLEPSKQPAPKQAPKQNQAPAKQPDKQKVDKARAQRLAEQKRLAEEKRQQRLVREKKDREKKAREAAEKKERERQEKLKKQRLAEEAARKKELEMAFADALADEEQYLAADEDEKRAASYGAYIEDRIARNWSRPPSARRDMEVELMIQMVPTGQVVSVTVVKTSGNGAFDRAAEQAVYKVERFDRIQELSREHPRVFESHFRRFRLVFRPDDLRL